MTISRLDKGLDFLISFVSISIGITIGQLLWPSIATVDRLDGFLVILVVLTILKVAFMIINWEEVK